MSNFTAYRATLTHWRDLAALDFYIYSVERGTYDAESQRIMADLAAERPDEARRQLRALMPCPCRDEAWFEYGNTSTAALMIERAIELIRAGDEHCIDPWNAPRGGHARACRERAIAAILGAAGDHSTRRMTVAIRLCDTCRQMLCDPEMWTGYDKPWLVTHGKCGPCLELFEAECDARDGEVA